MISLPPVYYFSDLQHISLILIKPESLAGIQMLLHSVILSPERSNYMLIVAVVPCGTPNLHVSKSDCAPIEMCAES